jgi:hypothetical protein
MEIQSRLEYPKNIAPLFQKSRDRASRRTFSSGVIQRAAPVNYRILMPHQIELGRDH